MYNLGLGTLAPSSMGTQQEHEFVGVPCCYPDIELAPSRFGCEQTCVQSGGSEGNLLMLIAQSVDDILQCSAGEFGISHAFLLLL
jgi:hypothetical protein